MEAKPKPPLGGRGGSVENRFPQVKGTEQKDPKSPVGIKKGGK